MISSNKRKLTQNASRVLTVKELLKEQPKLSKPLEMKKESMISIQRKSTLIKEEKTSLVASVTSSQAMFQPA